MIENYKQGIHFSWSFLFKMAAAAIFDFEKLLPFLNYLTDRHQN